jgi:hypothetical protein
MMFLALKPHFEKFDAKGVQNGSEKENIILLRNRRFSLLGPTKGWRFKLVRVIAR